MSINKRTQSSIDYIDKITGKLTLGRLLWAIRQGEDLSQVAFGAQLNISRQQVCDIENGRKPISPKMAARYAKALGYPPEQFIRLSLQDSLERAGFDMTVELKSNKKAGGMSGARPSFA